MKRLERLGSGDLAPGTKWLRGRRTTNDDERLAPGPTDDVITMTHIKSNDDDDDDAMPVDLRM